MIPRPRFVAFIPTTLFLFLPTLATSPGCDAPKKAAKSTPKEPITRRTTDDIRDVKTETAQGAQIAAPTQVPVSDPITVAAGVYRHTIERASELKIEYAVKLYQAETGEYPKTYEEFMEKIVKANSIRLPQLPHYQEYSYDVENHKLVILEYPARKNAPAAPPSAAPAPAQTAPGGSGKP